MGNKKKQKKFDADFAFHKPLIKKLVKRLGVGNGQQYCALVACAIELLDDNDADYAISVFLAAIGNRFGDKVTVITDQEDVKLLNATSPSVQTH